MALLAGSPGMAAAGFPSYAAPKCETLYDQFSLAALRRDDGGQILKRLATPAAKEEYLTKTFMAGDPAYAAADGFVRRVQELSAEEQAAWIDAIGAAYFKVPKANPNPLAPAAVGGRRLLNRALTQLQDAPAFFSSRVAAGGDGTAALREFLHRQTSLFRNDYNEEDVLAVVGELRRYVKDYAAKHPHLPTPEIVLGGSFPNGRARLKGSDIDLSVQPIDMRHDANLIRERANQVLRAAGRDANLAVEPHGEPAGFYGTTNPIVLLIKPDEVTLLVYPPGTPSHVKDRLTPAMNPARFSIQVP